MNLKENLKKIFKKHQVNKDIEKYILSETTNMGNSYFYYWDNLIPDIYKLTKLDGEYFSRAVKILFMKESYEAPKIYFSLFSKDYESFKKAIEFLIDKCDMDIEQAITYFFKLDELNKVLVYQILKYYYENYPNEVEEVINRLNNGESHTESGGYNHYHLNSLTYYLDAMAKLASNDFMDKVKQNINKLYNPMAFAAYLPFFENESDKAEVIVNSITNFLNKGYTYQNTKDEILNYLETGEKSKKFEKLIKKISTHNKSYLYNDFTSFIHYKKLDFNDIYEQRLITISMQIDKYRTIGKLLFTIYNDKFKYKLEKSKLDNLIINWEAISYENIIDYLTYHIAVEYYGLDAKKFLDMYLEEGIDKVFNSLRNISGKGMEKTLDILYKKDKDRTMGFIFDNIDIFKGKSLISRVVEILQMEKDNKKIIELTKYKKSNVREIAIRVLIKIDNKDNFKLLEKIRETEKSKAIQSLLSDYLGSQEKVDDGIDYFSKDAILERAKKAKLSSSSYNGIDTDKISKFKWKDDGKELNSKFSKYIISLLRNKDKNFIASQEAKKILSMLSVESINKFIENFVDDDYYWETDSFLRMLPFTKNDEYLAKLKAKITSLIYNYRGATAAKIVAVIAEFKTTKAVQLLDFLSFKKNAKDARVNRAAISAMDKMAEEMNLTKEDLLDFIIPDFGFDKEGKLMLDFGPRQFTVSLNNDLTMKITDNNGKTFKNLPKVGKNDDAKKGAEATKLFKTIKKDLKKQVKLERERLERGFSESRFWTGENWIKLFVNNPIMRQFAMNLVWGKYKNGELIESFRYLDDGTYSNIEDEELNIKNDDSISLVHPIELTTEQLEAWKEILEDYEITQPFEQINRPIFKISDEDKDKTVLDSFKGYMLSRFSLKNNLFKHGWSRGAVEDAGCFYYYDKSYGDGTNISLDFLGDYVGNYDDNMEVPIYDITLSKNGKEIKLSEISPRLYSELYYELKKITEKGSGFNAEWEKVEW